MAEHASNSDEPAGSLFVLHDRVEQMHPHEEVTHTEHGLTYLTDGWFRMQHGGPIEARAGTVTVVPAGIPHRALAGADMEYWLVGFCATCLHLDETQRLMQPFRWVRHGMLPVVTIAPARQERIVDYFQQLREEQLRAAPESPELMRSLLLLLLGEVMRAAPQLPAQAATGTLVADALVFIQQRCLHPISLRDVAAAVHRTPSHVAAMVKQATGYSVGRWIQAGRVAEAARRLTHTDDSLDTIATQVGWQDKTHFIRQFRKAYGTTPAAFRRQHRLAHPRHAPA